MSSLFFHLFIFSDFAITLCNRFYIRIFQIFENKIKIPNDTHISLSQRWCIHIGKRHQLYAGFTSVDHPSYYNRRQFIQTIGNLIRISIKFYHEFEKWRTVTRSGFVSLLICVLSHDGLLLARNLGLVGRVHRPTAIPSSKMAHHSNFKRRNCWFLFKPVDSEACWAHDRGTRVTKAPGSRQL